MHVVAADSSDVLERLRGLGVGAGDDVAVTLHPTVGIGLAVDATLISLATSAPAEVVDRVERAIGPRWVWWDRTTADPLATAGTPIGRCWDLLTVDRLLHGGWRTSPAIAWARLHGLATDALPTMGQLGLLDDASGEGGDLDDPVRPDGHLRPEWITGGWANSPSRLAGWARLAGRAAARQRDLLDERPDPARARSAAHAESAAEYLCAELTATGLPIDVAVAERLVIDSVGQRPRDVREEEAARRRRDDAVLARLGAAGAGTRVDLRNPTEVKAMLRRVGLDLPDTRATRLEQHRDHHPLVDALLTWRKAERIATTYGFRWLDEHVRDGRLRGEWTSSDGAAGRMTATAGLHNLPADLRPAVAADPGHRLVRADLGQVEPRVLAAVSGDPALVAATADVDLYQPVADRLGVAREIAKVAVLGAMYGATTGQSAHALRGLEQAYPVAMGFLERTAATGRRGDDVFTVGGRRVPMWIDESVAGDLDRAHRVAAARGRFARNAVVQGAAAEFFKVWALVVRRRGRALDARIVLCLHDELLVHVPTEHADAAVAMVRDAVDEAAHHWSPVPAVRFVAGVTAVERWSDAKP